MRSAETQSDIKYSIPAGAYTILDMVYPNPDSDTIGLFHSSDTKRKIMSAPQEFTDKNKIIIRGASASSHVITGDFLLRENIGKYSTKLATLLDLLDEIIGRSKGNPSRVQKTMIYHNRVKMSGVLQIQELLRVNGYLDEYSDPIETTKCCICGVALGKHNVTGHQYMPARFVMAHSDVDRAVMNQSLSKYNHTNNINGAQYMFLVASKLIKESYNFNSVQNVVILSMPVNISTFMQIIGRAIRKYSHVGLPSGQHRVFISILISIPNEESSDKVGPEMYKCAEKLADYIGIQQIEQKLNSIAVDADINRDIIMPKDIIAEYFPNDRCKDDQRNDPSCQPVGRLGALYFEPAVTVPGNLPLSKINLSTFTAYKYYEEEINIIVYVIKRLFILSPVWKYDDLFAVRSPPIGLEVNPALFQEANFIIALNRLVVARANVLSARQSQMMTETRLIEQLFDPAENNIMINGVNHKIEHIGAYYVLFPIINAAHGHLLINETVGIDYTRDKERAMIRSLIDVGVKPIIDADSFARGNVAKTDMIIQIREYLSSAQTNKGYEDILRQFISSDLSNPAVFLFDYPVWFQTMFIASSIQEWGKGPPELVGARKVVFRLLESLNVIIMSQEVMLYKDIFKQFGGVSMPKHKPVGYMISRNVRLYDGSRWFDVNKVAMNRQANYKENETIIGYIEGAGSGAALPKFKLRKPTQIIRQTIHNARIVASEEIGSAVRTAISDTRLIEKGIVCNTKNKADLMNIAARIGISLSKIPQNELRVRHLCQLIQQRLLDKEMAERSRGGRYKYLYGWWDESVDLVSLV
jgi:hypothetical protein